MIYSPSQFQKDLSMAEFQHRYGTEEKCAGALFASRWPKGFACPECGGRACCILTQRRL